MEVQIIKKENNSNTNDDTHDNNYIDILPGLPYPRRLTDERKQLLGFQFPESFPAS